MESKEILRQKLRDKIKGFRQQNEKPTITPKVKKDMMNELKKLPPSLQKEMYNIAKNGSLNSKQDLNALLNKVKSSDLNNKNINDLLNNKMINKVKSTNLNSESTIKTQFESLNSSLLNMNLDKVTKRMSELYETVCLDFKESNITIPKPIELLNNPNLSKEKFKEYLENIIEVCKTNNVSKESFVNDYLNSSYTKYHIEVLGRQIIPEKLSSLIL
jgi:hypothetical protein